MIHLSDGVLEYATPTVDQSKNSVSLTDETDPNWKCDFAYLRTDDQLLSLRGNINGDGVALKLHRLNLSKSRLTGRGFHWINEYPF
jgi:hypothetical protein